MTDQPLARRAVSAARRRPQISAITLAACVSALAITAIATAEAKQQCSAAQGSGGYWSWRIIDGRKCWYEGKPMLSKSLLEWSARAPAQARSSKMDSDNNRELASASVEKRHDPLDAQARAPDDAGTFEALWRDRIEKR